MKTIFKKSNLPFLKHALHAGEGRENWTLARMMQDENGLQHQVPAEIALLERGARDGDAWSICELARTYFRYSGDLLLPRALSLWKSAIFKGDEGAMRDVECLPIYDRILGYRSPDENFYLTAEMQCAMLAEWHLTALGCHPWERQEAEEKKARCVALIEGASRVLKIPSAAVEFISALSLNGSIVDGLAHWDKRLSFREELLTDLERMVEIIFHELGHIVAFEILRENENSQALKALYGITDDRVRSWRENAQGYEVPTSEEDPDTLSYGVYTLWATFFLPHKSESV